MTDGKVFDRISVVAERYGPGKRPSPHRDLPARAASGNHAGGKKLRLVANDHFYLVWTVDDWKTVRHMESRHVGCAGHFADMETEPGQAGRVIFTMKWRLDNRWEGRNFEVRLIRLERSSAENQETAVPRRRHHLKERVGIRIREQQETEVFSKEE